METKDIESHSPSVWVPETRPRILGTLGKLGEETNELGEIISRCIIQGIDECDPATGKLNRLALEDEIADVRALSRLSIETLGLRDDYIQNRADKKYAFKKAWTDQLPMLVHGWQKLIKLEDLPKDGWVDIWLQPWNPAKAKNHDEGILVLQACLDRHFSIMRDVLDSNNWRTSSSSAGLKPIQADFRVTHWRHPLPFPSFED